MNNFSGLNNVGTTVPQYGAGYNYGPNFPRPDYNTPAPNIYNLPRYNIVKVRGQNGAEAFQMGPNSQALLLDETDPIIWFVSTDGAGYKTCTPWDVMPHQTAPQIDVQSLENRVRALEEQINAKSNSGTKSTNGSKKQQQQSNAGTDA